MTIAFLKIYSLFLLLALIETSSIPPVSGAFTASAAGAVGWVVFGIYRLSQGSMTWKEYIGSIPLAGMVGFLLFAFYKLEDWHKLLALCLVGGTMAPAVIHILQTKTQLMLGKRDEEEE